MKKRLIKKAAKMWLNGKRHKSVRVIYVDDTVAPLGKYYALYGRAWLNSEKLEREIINRWYASTEFSGCSHWDNPLNIWYGDPLEEEDEE